MLSGGCRDSYRQTPIPRPAACRNTLESVRAMRRVLREQGTTADRLTVAQRFGASSHMLVAPEFEAPMGAGARYRRHTADC